MKIVLGSVQFGLPYGVNNHTGIPSNVEVKNILEKAINCGIDTIDTAAAYGNAEERLGTLSTKGFHFISKFPTVANKEELADCFARTTANLHTRSLYGYMAHNADVLIANSGLWSELQKLKSESKVQKVGYSLYSPEQLDKLLDIGCMPDIVQFPYSLLDRKFECRFGLLASLNIEVHVRSVFLQGLYFKDISTLRGNLLPLSKSLARLHDICSVYAVPMSSLALSFAVHQPELHKIVIGVDSASQLEENITNIVPIDKIAEAIEAVKSIHIKEPDLLNPVNW